MLALPVQQELAAYQDRYQCGAECALDWFKCGMSRHWAWNVAREFGVEADGPFCAVAFH
jgi:hypothetical protein